MNIIGTLIYFNVAQRIYCFTESAWITLLDFAQREIFVRDTFHNFKRGYRHLHDLRIDLLLNPQSSGGRSFVEGEGRFYTLDRVVCHFLTTSFETM
jgi:hypothetical protein